MLPLLCMDACCAGCLRAHPCLPACGVLPAGFIWMIIILMRTGAVRGRGTHSALLCECRARACSHAGLPSSSFSTSTSQPVQHALDTPAASLRAVAPRLQPAGSQAGMPAPHAKACHVVSSHVVSLRAAIDRHTLYQLPYHAILWRAGALAMSYVSAIYVHPTPTLWDKALATMCRTREQGQGAAAVDATPRPPGTDAAASIMPSAGKPREEQDQGEPPSTSAKAPVPVVVALPVTVAAGSAPASLPVAP